MRLRGGGAGGGQVCVSGDSGSAVVMWTVCWVHVQQGGCWKAEHVHEHAVLVMLSPPYLLHHMQQTPPLIPPPPNNTTTTSTTIHLADQFAAGQVVHVHLWP